MVSTAYRIKEFREELGMSQEQLSKTSGVSRSIISELETGKRTITTTDTLVRISKALGKSIQDIFLP